MDCYENYKALAMAIVEQAASDYKRHLMGKVQSTTPSKGNLEAFFRSDWFVVLTEGNIDGETLLVNMQEVFG